MRVVKPGQKYQHFKGGIYEVVIIAVNTETMEKMVIYRHEDKVWARPYEMFIGKVDKEKYPDVKQKYRFELVQDK